MVMSSERIYLDNHSTTRVDPRVVDAMLPYFGEQYGNAGSTSHDFGWEARDAVEAARATLAAAIGAAPAEIVFTSGATESNNLALRGVAERPRRRGDHIVSVATEHKAILDPLARLARRGFEVTLLPVMQVPSPQAGLLDLNRLAEALRDDTCLVSVMLANNEIGVLQPVAEIAQLCRERGVWLHTDATQAVGKLPVNVLELDVDLMSFSAHKLYGPKGIGALFVRRSSSPVRLEPQIDGGGQEHGFRSGTLNVPGIVGFAKALALCLDEMEAETGRLRALRDQLFAGLQSELPDVLLNGPTLEDPRSRLANNLNCTFPQVDGESLLLNMQTIAVSSGSACTSANPEPSHVLRALGRSLDDARASLRFGIGRFNTAEHIETAIAAVSRTVRELRSFIRD
jgi:cysteine desulfurase